MVLTAPWSPGTPFASFQNVPQPFESGSTARVSIARNFVDSFYLHLTAANPYYFEVLKSYDWANENVPPTLSVYDVNGTVVDSSTAQPGQIVSYTPAVTGTYIFTFFGRSSYSSNEFTGGDSWVTVKDTTTGGGSEPFMASYSGPVAGLVDQYISPSANGLEVAATSNNVFIHGGAGDDKIQAYGGSNVIDGGTGSNLLIGGTGNDTFFVDDRAPSATIWSTIANFHGGDNATIWGVTADDFSLTWHDNQGPKGFAGLTGVISSSGRPGAKFTLAGFTTADLTNGRLSTNYGRSSDLPGLAGSAYLIIRDVTTSHL